MTEEKILNIRNNSEEASNYFSKKLAFTLGPVELKELSEEDKNIKMAALTGLIQFLRHGQQVGINFDGFFVVYGH